MKTMFNKLILLLLLFFVTIFSKVDHASAFKGYDEANNYSTPIIESINYALGVRNVKIVKVFGKYLYVGTPEGFYIYNTESEQYDFFDYNNGLISQSVFSFTMDPDGKNIWIGTYGGGLARLDGKNMKTYNVPDGLCDSFVYDVKFNESGVMWIATWSGLNKVKGDIDKRSNWERFTVENTNHGLSDNWVYAIDIDSKNRVWLGTEVGVSVFDGKKWEKWDHKDGMGASFDVVEKDNKSVMSSLQGDHHNSQLKDIGQLGHSTNFNPNYVVSMTLGPKGNLWVGTWGGGLAKFDTTTKKFKNYTVKDGLPGNYILALEFDKKGILWVGSNNGLSKFDGQTFVNYSEDDGLFSQFIFSIAFAPEGEIWLGGWNGVSHILSIKPETSDK